MHLVLARVAGVVGLALLALLVILVAAQLLTPLVAVILLAPVLGMGIVVSRAILFIARRARYSTGQEHFLNQVATVIVDLAPLGRVRFHGENWAAVLDEPFLAEQVPVGAQVRIVGITDLRLIVTPSVNELVNRARNRSLADSAAS